MTIFSRRDLEKSKTRGGSMGKRVLKKVNIFDIAADQGQCFNLRAGGDGVTLGWESLWMRGWMTECPTQPKADVRVKLRPCRSLRTSRTRFLVGVKVIMPWSCKLEGSIIAPKPLLILSPAFLFLISKIGNRLGHTCWWGKIERKKTKMNLSRQGQSNLRCLVSWSHRNHEWSMGTVSETWASVHRNYGTRLNWRGALDNPKHIPNTW